VFERPLLRGQFYTDTMDARNKSLDGNRYAQVFANQDFFAMAYPMEHKSSAGEGLQQFVHDLGRPEKLTFDGSAEQCGKRTEFMKNVRKYSINHHVTESFRPNHNFVESVIREIRKKWFRIMVRKKYHVVYGTTVSDGCVTFRTEPRTVHGDSVGTAHSRK
jgi:hypothetical protein